MQQRTPLSPALWRGHVVCRVLLALLTAGLFAAWVSEPVAAQGNVTPSSPCLDSRNLTELPSGASRNITNQPVLSSNGAQVAFWSTNNLVANGNNDGNIEIFVQNTNTGAVVQLTDSVGSILGGFNLDPSINTAGDRIAFFSDRDLVGTNADGNFEIFLARFASGAWTIRQVTNTSGSANLFPSINGDGTRIAFVSDDPGLDTVDPDRRNPDRNFEIMLATVSATGVLQQIRQLTTTPAGITNDQPSINVTGARIAYSAGSGQSVQVFVWDAATGASTQLTTSGNSDQAAINGDGTRITYIATNDSGGQSRVVLHRLSVDGTESSSQVIVPPASNTTYRSPSISSNGERVVFVAEQGTGENRTVNVYLYDSNSGLAVPISTLGGGAGEQPTISGDGTRVTFVGTRSVGGSTTSSGSDIYINECPQADLQLSLDNPPPATILAGVNLNYTLRVRNAGPSRADNAAIRSDLASLPALPANVSRILPSNCSVQVNQLVCTLGSLAVGGQASVTLGFNVPGNAGLADIVSRYTVVADVVDPLPADNDTGVLTTRVIEEAALSLAVSPSANLILAGSGEILTYTLTIQNAGPSQARGAVLTDTLPSEVTLVNALLVSGGGVGAQCPQTANDTLVVCRLGDLGVGSTTVVAISIQAKASAPATLNNVAEVRSLTDELDKTNNVVTTSTPVDRAADLRISKSGPTTVVAGTELTYTLFVTSTGPADATGVTVTDLLPANVRFVRDVTAAGGSCAGANANQSAVCTVTGTLTPNASRRFDFVAQVLSTAPAGVISNKATVVSQRRDPDESNNTSNEVQTTVTLLADLGVFKTLQSPTDTDNVNVFDVIVFAIQVRNDGPSQAYSVVVTDVLPAEYLTFNITNTQTTAGFYNSATGVWTLNQPLPVGRTETLLLAAMVRPEAGGQTVTNTASVSGGQPEPQPNNNQNSFSVTVRPNLADLSVVKTSVPVTATAGQPLTYTITVTNSGPTRARNVVVTDTLSAGVNFVSANPDPSQPNDQCIQAGSTVTCSRRDPPLPNTPDTGTLDANAALTYRIVITHTVADVITNAVRVDSSTPDIIAGNDAYTLPVTVNPDVPYALTLRSSLPLTVTAGEPFVPAPVVELRDQFGNLVNVGTGNNDTIRFVAYSNPTCTTPTGTAFNNRDREAGSGLATFTNLNYTTAETIYLRAEDQHPSRTNVESACSAAVDILPGPADHFTLTIDNYPATPIVAGDTARTLTVTASDAFNNVATSYTGSKTLTFTGASPSPSPVVNPTVAGQDFGQPTGLTFTNGVADAALALYRAETFTLTADASAISGAMSVTVDADAGLALSIVAAPPPITAGVASEVITVERLDQFGNVNTTDDPVTVLLSGNGTGTNFFRDEADANNVPFVTIGNNSGEARFRYVDQVAGTPTITVTDQAGQLDPDSLTVTVVPAPATKLVYATLPPTITAGGRTGVIRVAREDEFGNRNDSDGPITVALTTTSAGTTVGGLPRFLDSTPSQITSVGIVTSTADFFYADSKAGTHTITATSSGLTSAVQTVTVEPADATQLVMLTAAQTVTAGVVSDVYTVQRQDQFGNPNTSQADLSLSLDSTSSTDGFLDVDAVTSTSVVTIATTSSTASFKYTDTVQGVYLIKVGDGAGPLFDATQTVTVTAAPAAHLVIADAPTSVTAGQYSGLSLITVERHDIFGNVNRTDGPVTVVLTSTSAGAYGFFTATETLTVTTVAINTGSGSVDVRYRDTLAGLHTLHVSDPLDSLTPDTVGVTVTAAAATKLVYATLPPTITAGGRTGVIRVAREDEFGNRNDSDGPITVALTTTSAGTTVGGLPRFLDSTPSQITSVGIVTSTAEFYYEDSLAGTHTITATSSGLTAAAQVVTVEPADATQLVMLSASQTVTAGIRSQQYMVQRQDQFGNFVSNEPALSLSLASTSPTPLPFLANDGVTPTSSVTIPNAGTNATFYYTDTVQGVYTITVGDGAGPLVDATQRVTVAAASATRLVFATAPQTIIAGAESGVITVAREDAFGNRNTTGADLTVPLDSSSAGAFAFRSTPGGGSITQVTIANGSSAADFYYTDTLAATHSLTASAQGGSLTSAVQSVTVQPANATQVVFTTPAQTVTAGVVSDVYTVQRQDQFGNPNTSQADLSLSLDSTSSTDGFLDVDAVTSTSVVTIATTSSTASFKYTDTVQGVYTITVSGAGVTAVTQAVTVTAAPATKLVFTAAPPIRQADGPITGPFRLERRDQFDNPNSTDSALSIDLNTTSAGPASFLASSSGGSPITDVQIVTSTMDFYYTDNKAGIHTITADGGSPFLATTDIEVRPGTAHQLTFLTPQRVITAGTTSDLITIQVQDTFGNAVTPTVGSPVVVGLSSTNLGGPYDFRDVDFAPDITQRVIEGTSTASFRYYDETAGTWSIGVNASLPQANNSQSLTVNPDNAAKLAFVTPPRSVVAGAVSSVITVQRQDDYGNPNTANATVTLDVATDAIGAHDIFTQTGGPPISYLTAQNLTIGFGSHSASFFYTDTVRGTKTITVSDVATVPPILASASQTIAVTGGQATRLVLSGPSATTAGTPINLTVSALDSLGNLADYEGPHTLTFGGAGVAVTGEPPTVSDSGGQPQPFGTPTSLLFSGGVANGALTLYLSQTAIITATGQLPDITTVPDGNLTVTVSPNDATHVEARTLPVGGDVVPTQAVSAGTTIPIYAVGLDTYRNETGTVDADWTIATTDEVAPTDIAPTVGVSMTTFTARKVGTAVITPVFTPLSLVSIPTGVITVTAGNAVKVRVETTGERFGTVVPSQAISAGTNITVYAVTRDAFDNFVGNPLANWAVITATGGVTTTDLITTSNGASTVFRGQGAGSGYIQATFGGLPWVPSGQITVTPDDAAYLKLTAPSTTFTAGVTQTLSITAFDSFANVVVGYSGQKTLTFSGAQPSTKLVFTPTVVNDLGAAVHFGQPTDLTFANGVLDTSGGAGRMTLYRRETSIPINATDGLIGSSPTGTLTVTVNTGARERLDISGPSVVTAGVGVQLTIRVVDLYGNVDTSFTGQPAANVNLVFTGANQAPNGVDNPTVTRDDGNQALNFNQNTRMDFVNGETVFGTNGGIMTLVNVETTTIHVTGAAGVDSLPYGGLPVTVLPGLSQNIGLNLTSPQVVSQTFTGAGFLLIRDQYQNPVTNYNAATRPITITGNGTFAPGTVRLAGSGNDNVLNEGDDVINGSAVLTTTGLGMVYIGPSGTGTFTAAAAPPQAGQATIAAGTSGNITMNSGTPVSAAILGRLDGGAYASALSVTAGTPISLQVSLRDIAGNLTPLGLSSFSVAFAGAPTSGGVTPPDPTVVDRTSLPVAFGQTTTLDFSDGQSTVTGAGANGVLRLYQSGVYTITATGPGVVTSPSGGLAVTVTPGPLAQLDLQLTSPQTVGQEFVEINTLTVRDTYNNVLVDWQNGTRNVTFTVTSPIGATITFAGSANDNQLEPGDFSDGVANLSAVFFERMIYNGLPEEATIQAQSGAVIGTANVTINAAPP